MNWKIIPVAILIVFSIQGCGGFKTVEMSAVISQEQQQGYMETITSQKKHFVSLAPYGENIPASSDTAFILFIKNCGESPIDISTQNISAEFFGNTSKWASRSITVLSYDELMNRLRSRQLRAESAANATYKNYTFHHIDALGNDTGFWAAPGEPFSGSYSDAYLSNPNDEFTSYSAATNHYRAAGQKMQVVEEKVLQPQTLQPGEGGGGLVVCDTDAMNSKVEGKFHIAVSVNGEQHEFTFNRSMADRRQDHYEQKK